MGTYVRNGVVFGGGASLNATVETAGIVKPDGTSITIDDDGTIHGASTYTLPKATTEILGGVKVDGDTVTITDDGVISAQEGITYLTKAEYDALGTSVLTDGKLYAITDDSETGDIPVATTTSTGVVKPDGTTITIDSDGTLHGTPKPTTETKTLLASGWTGTSIPYTYDLGYASTYDVEVMLPSTATADEVLACQKAQIISSGNDNILRAWGEKPTVDISIVVKKVVK